METRPNQPVNRKYRSLSVGCNVKLFNVNSFSKSMNMVFLLEISLLDRRDPALINANLEAKKVYFPSQNHPSNDDTVGSTSDVCGTLFAVTFIFVLVAGVPGSESESDDSVS